VYRQNLEHVAAAEDSGFSYFWLTEQHFFAEIGHSACPEMFLAALSQRTRKIRLGFAVILMPCHNPSMVAERVAYTAAPPCRIHPRGSSARSRMPRTPRR
jgi:alkanesulfonate monooxygenase SsuD/methylene tetrahydromethanopterin reductase-like flavin-dependent oxidoreductase (luciferase family)